MTKKSTAEDRRASDRQWRDKLSKRVNQLEENQKNLMVLLKKNTELTQSIVDDTSEMRDLTRCLRGVARFILWFAGKASTIASGINRVIKPLLVLMGFFLALFAIGIAFLNHGKIPEWALRVLTFLFT